MIAIGIVCTSRSPPFAAVTIVSSMMAIYKVMDTATRSTIFTRRRGGSLESAPFRRDLVLALRKVSKREVAGALVSASRSATPRIVMRTPDSGAPVWSEIDPATVLPRTGRPPKQAPTTAATHAASIAVSIEGCEVSFSSRHCAGSDGRLATHRFQTVKAGHNQMRSVCRRFFCAVLAGWLVAGAWPSDAQTPVRQVLLLQSFHHGVMVHDYLTGNLQVDLDQLTGRPVNVVQVNVSPAGNVGASDKAIVDYIQSLYADRPKPDLIVTIAGPASVFARKYRRQLFPETPLLLAAVDQRFLGDAPLGENETAVPVNGDFPRGIDQILELLPQTKHVFMVMGSGSARQILACSSSRRNSGDFTIG